VYFADIIFSNEPFPQATSSRQFFPGSFLLLPEMIGFHQIDLKFVWYFSLFSGLIIKISLKYKPNF